MTLLKDIFTAAIFLPLALCYGYASKKIRPTLAERLGGGAWGLLPRDNVKWLWIHGASVGELAAIEPLLEQLHQTLSNRRILITATSATGCERARKLPHVAAALVLPFDLGLLYRRALKQISVDQLVVLETELWPNLFSFARSRGIETVILNGRISDETFPRYLKWKWYFSRLFKSVAKIFAQSQIDAQRYLALGVRPEALIVSGSTKFDIAYASREELQKRYRTEFGLNPQRPTLAIGCLRKEEESLLLGAMESIVREIPEIQVVIVPRHPERFMPVANELQRLGFDFHLRSKGANTLGKPVVLVDAMGELSAAYALAEVAIVCGAFSNAGGHNPLEAAAVGSAVIIGPQHYNVRTAVEVLSKSSVLQIADGPTQLVQQIVSLFADDQKLRTMPAVAAQAVRELAGTSQRVANYLRATQYVA